MKPLQRFLAAVLFTATTSTVALAAPASDESIDTLLGVTRAEAMIDGVYAQLEEIIRQSMQQAIRGRPLSDEQQRLLDQMPPRFANLIRQEFSWALMKPQFVQLYRETFDQEEVDGLIAFYRSRIGQSFVGKMPTLMQKSIALSQASTVNLMPKLKAAMQQALVDAKIQD